MSDASPSVAIGGSLPAANEPNDVKGSKKFAIPKIVEKLVIVALFVIAIWTLHHELKSISVRDVMSSFRATPLLYIGLSLAFTALNFVALIGYDYFAVRQIKYPLSFRQIATASSLYYAFSNSLGTLLGGTPVRVRLYSAWGMSTAELLRLFLLITVAFWVGMAAISGVLFVFSPFQIPARFHLPMQDSRSLGLILLTVILVYLSLCMFRKTPLHFFSVNLQPPPFYIALAQIAIGVLDFAFASAALYVLLPADVSVDFLTFTAIYLLAMFVALVSHVPGGLGVLELVLVTMLGRSDHQFLGALVAYRVIYYLIPLAIALVAIALYSARNRLGKVKQAADVAFHWSSIIGPRVITGAVFIAGLLLLVSGALPSSNGRMALLRMGLPLPIVEVSHLIGSIVGALLLVLARGLYRRIDAAWGLTVGLLVVGIVVSLTKGFDYEEAIILLVLLIGMIPCRKQFYRRGNIFMPQLNWVWISALIVAVGLSIWLVLFSYQHVEYSNDLWWNFTYDGDAPRSLRALLGASVVIMIAAFGQLLRPVRHVTEYANDEELVKVADIVKNSEAANANLALLGDKRFIYSKDGLAAVMFDREGKSWISMGDPIGPSESADDAAWKFMEACDAAGAWPVFYQVNESSLGRYVEMGLTMIKLGEVARVSLPDFSLEGAARKDLRRTKRKAEEFGMKFEIIPRKEVKNHLPKLREISEAWLNHKSAGEKGFSLGFFDDNYLQRFDIAIIKNAEERILAFANMWEAANKRELSVDLMRYVPDSPHGVMEHLFTEMMLYGHDSGYEWFDLGMAPLAGVTPHRLGPLWNQVSGVLFKHGEQFYNFQGLRNYKNKFNPVWTSKYLASPGGFATPQILTNVSTLISGGVGKLLRR